MSHVTNRLIALLISASSTSAFATLTQIDSAVFGQGKITRDSTAGIDWLTPNATVGMSFSDVRAALITDSRFAGFRVATLTELESLYIAAAIPDINTPGYGALYGTPANVPGVQVLQGLVGITYSVQVSGQFLAETAGFVGDSFISPANGFLSVNIGNLVFRPDVVTPSGTISFASAYTNWASAPIGSQYQGVGTWLVSSIPEPATYVSFLAGVMLLAGLRTRVGA